MVALSLNKSSNKKTSNKKPSHNKKTKHVVCTHELKHKSKDWEGCLKVDDFAEKQLSDIVS